MKTRNLTIRGLHEGLKKKEFSAVELAKETLNNAKEQDNKMFHHINFEQFSAFSAIL